MDRVVTDRLTITPLRRHDVDDLAAMLVKDALYEVIGDAPQDRDDARTRATRWTGPCPRPDTRWVNHVVRLRDAGFVVGLRQATVLLDPTGPRQRARSVVSSIPTITVEASAPR